MSLRRELRNARRGIDTARQRRHAAAAARRYGRELAFLRARRIAFYWPADGELDPRPLLRKAYKDGKACFLPVIRTLTGTRRGGRLWFAHFRPLDPLHPNRFGIPEPTARRYRLTAPWKLDLLLIPLVGFDAECHRIGMGGGFYDRTLGYLRHRRHWRRPRLVGIGHECQRVDRIEPRPWDIALDAVVTECRIYASPRRTVATHKPLL